MGSMGFETKLFYFLKVFEVELKPPGPPMVTLAVLLLKSDEEVNLPKPSLPEGFEPPLKGPALLVSRELFLMLVP